MLINEFKRANALTNDKARQAAKDGAMETFYAEIQPDIYRDGKLRLPPVLAIGAWIRIGKAAFKFIKKVIEIMESPRPVIRPKQENEQ